jgi:hypothetical protein
LSATGCPGDAPLSHRAHRPRYRKVGRELVIAIAARFMQAAAQTLANKVPS